MLRAVAVPKLLHIALTRACARWAADASHAGSDAAGAGRGCCCVASCAAHGDAGGRSAVHDAADGACQRLALPCVRAGHVIADTPPPRLRVQSTESRIAAVYSACANAELQMALKAVRRQIALVAASMTFLSEKMSMRTVRAPACCDACTTVLTATPRRSWCRAWRCLRSAPPSRARLTS